MTTVKYSMKLRFIPALIPLASLTLALVAARPANAQGGWGPSDGAPQEATCQLRPSNRLFMVKTASDGSVWASNGNLYGYTGFQMGGPGAATSAPTCVSLENDVAWVFIRGDNYSLWGRTSDPNSVWHNFGYYLTSAPSAAGYLPGRIEVVMRGDDYGIWRMRIDPSSLRIVTWESIGGYATSAPTAVMRSRGVIDVFVRSGDNALYWKTWEDSWGTWSVWEPLGGKFLGAPSVASESSDHMVVVGVGTDGYMYYRRYTWPTTWTAYWAFDPSINVNSSVRMTGDSLSISRASDNSYNVHGWSIDPTHYWFGDWHAYATTMSF